MPDQFDEQAEELLYPTVEDEYTVHPDNDDELTYESNDFEDDGQPSDLQEHAEFAQDGDEYNMYPTEDGFYSNCGEE